MKIFRRLVFIPISLILIYFMLPVPSVPPLPDSLKSDEPGDTVQISGVSAYYTDISRQEVVKFYENAFSRSSFLNLPLPVIVLNHPPEYTRRAIRDTTNATFLYELVHPGRDSLFINGWDSAEDPQLKNAKDPTQIINKNDRFYQRKVTLRLMPSSRLLSLLIFTLAIVLSIKILAEARSVYLSFRKKL
ncbi:MAG TPA: hypothetical protein VMW41_05110 [Candidatus Bathyarchaeia archaeon]|nr:hypothetical protein [Candidatus Bathyarchaeia archaeon]